MEAGPCDHCLPLGKGPAVTSDDQVRIPLRIAAKITPGTQKCVESLIVVISDRADKYDHRPMGRLPQLTTGRKALGIA